MKNRVFGSYEKLEVNTPALALYSMTGFEIESYSIFILFSNNNSISAKIFIDLTGINSDDIISGIIWNRLLYKYSKIPLMTCTIQAEPHFFELKLDNGLIKGRK
jgi:hypothetical protein